LKTEIICIGTELLLGDTINTNASYISQKLSELGMNCYYHTVVGDNPDRIKQILEIALKRSDLLILTGGLGPTDDDITIKTLAEYFKEEMVLDKDSLDKIEFFFKSIGVEMSETSKKQAMFPKNAQIIPNSAGTASGIIWEVEKFDTKKIIMTFPGVPKELYRMWEETAHNYLKQFSDRVLVKRVLKFMGIPEDTLGEKLKDLMEYENPTVAPLVAKGEVNIRIAAKAENTEKALELIKPVEQEIIKRAGEHFFGSDNDTIEGIIGNLLLENKLTLSTAESCTGGLVSSRLTDVSGSSAYIKLNLVTYSNEAKIKMLGVSEEILKTYGAVSEQNAAAMAEGVRKVSRTDIGLGITGIAGPGGATPKKTVGLVYIGISNEEKTEVHKINANPDWERTEIKFFASEKALEFLKLFIEENY